ncbi:MAG: hypothetical protein LT082_08850 [Comamonas sp.]|nr:hypothetical protein [Comamonas sp.]
MKFRTAFMTALLAFGLTQAFAADPESLSYKGVLLGASVAEFQEKLPDYQCRESHCTFSKDACNGALTSVSKAVVDAYNARSDACKERTSFGGALVTNGSASFLDGRFAKLVLTIPTPHMEVLLAAVMQRYGNPTVSNDAPFVNGLGAQFPNWQKTWTIGDDHLTLVLRGGRLDEGGAVLTSAEQGQAAEDSQAKKVQQGSKDF